MATVQIVYRWPDGAQIVTSISVKRNFPDAIDEARSQCIRAFREAFAEVIGEDVEAPSIGELDEQASAPDA